MFETRSAQVSSAAALTRTSGRGRMSLGGAARLAVATLAGAFALALALAGGAAPAQADLLGSGGLGLPVGPASSLNEVFNGSAASELGALACGAGTTVAGGTSGVPGVGSLTGSLAPVICALQILGYAYRTTLVEPDGTQIVRYTHALVGIPTPIDVDGDGLPDFVGTLSPTLALNGISLSVRRLGFAAAGKVSVEAVVFDPASPDTYIGLGEDGTAAGTATSWSTTIKALSITGGTVDLGLGVTSSGAPGTLGLLGEEFSGADPDTPTGVDRGDVLFSPVPASLTTEIKLSQGRQEALLTTPTPTTATAHVNLLSAGEEQDIDATVDQLPSSVDIVHQTLDGHQTATYTASAPIASLSVAYHDHVGSTLVSAAELDATGVPAGLSVDQFGERTSVTVASGSIGSIEARYGYGTDIPAPGAGTGPYLAFHRTSTVAFTAGLRLTHLESASVDPSGPYVGDLVLADPLASLPLSAEDDVSGITLSGSLSNLPSHTTVTVDTGAGTVTFDGHGTGIAEIALHAVSTRGAFFSRASRIDATIDGIPALETISLHQAAGALTANASAPIGQISLLASDGSGPPAGSGSIASYVDTPSQYAAFVRLSGLESISFSGDPLAGQIQTTAPQTLNLNADTSLGDVTGQIDQLPSSVTFSMAPSGSDQIVDVQTGGPISQITLHGTGMSGLPLSATNFDVELDTLPQHVTVTIPGTGSSAPLSVDPHGAHLGHLLANLYKSTPPPFTPASDQLLFYNAQTSQIGVSLNKVGAFSVTESASPLHLSYDISSDPLSVEVTLADGTYVNAGISNPSAATLDYDPNFEGAAGVRGLTYDAAAPISEISLETDAGGGYITAQIFDIPEHLRVCLDAKGGGPCLTCPGPVSGLDYPCFQPTIPGDFGDGENTYAFPNPKLAFEFLPANLDPATGFLEPPTSGVDVDATICPDQPSKASCLSGSGKPEKIVVGNLNFDNVEAQFGTADQTAYFSLNTMLTPITGSVALTDAGDSSPDLVLAPTGGLAADEFIFAMHWGLSLNPLATYCEHRLEITNPFTLDVNVPLLGLVNVGGFVANFVGADGDGCGI
jgi:hypothetical protein